MTSLSVVCHANDGKFTGGAKVDLDLTWDWSKCLAAFQQASGGSGDSSVVRIFTQSGYEVRNLQQLIKDEDVCISLDGSDFVQLAENGVPSASASSSAAPEKTDDGLEELRRGSDLLEEVFAKHWVMKFIIVGSCTAGKSCILSRFAEKKFPIHTAPTLGCDFSSTIVKVKDALIRINIWDTAGQEQHRAITKAYFRDSAAAILVYDISKTLTFDQIPSWLSAVRQNSNNPNITLALCGNKVDLANADPDAREVPRKKGEDFAERNNMQFFETSAKEDINVSYMFQSTVLQIVQKLEQGLVSPDVRSSGIKSEEGSNPGVDVHAKKRKSGRGCCRK